MRSRRMGSLNVRGATVALGLGFVLVLSTGCGRMSHRAPLRVLLESMPDTVDPHRHNEVVAWAMLCNLYDGLVGFSGDMRLEPVLAESWEQISETEIRFHLRAGVSFHDGSSFGADDVVASFERARSGAERGIQHHLLGIRAVRAEDGLTVVVETEEPAPTLLNRLTYLFIVPASHAAEEEITTPIGTGPYRFLGRDPDGTVHLESVVSWRGSPEVGRVDFLAEPNADRAAGHLLAGDADVVRNFPEAQLAEVVHARGVRTQVQPTMAVRILVTVPGAAHGEAGRALADPRVRRAMVHAIDRRLLVERAFGGSGGVATQFVHPKVFGYDPGIEPLAYSPARARQLLAEAGFEGGFQVELGHAQLPLRSLSPLIEGLAQVGIRVTGRPLPLSELLDRASEIPLLYYARTCTTADASDFLDSLIHAPDPARGYGTENWSGYSNAEVDRLIEAAGHELDPSRRLALLQRVQRLALDDMPILPLVINWTYLGLSDRIEAPSRFDAWLWVANFRWRQ